MFDDNWAPKSWKRKVETENVHEHWQNKCEFLISLFVCIFPPYTIDFTGKHQKCKLANAWPSLFWVNEKGENRIIVIVQNMYLALALAIVNNVRWDYGLQVSDSNTTKQLQYIINSALYACNTLDLVVRGIKIQSDFQF